jgi:DNA-binding XRE family transcriptional regulator
MNRPEHMTALARRVEQVRAMHELNRSAFARRVGLTPQTLNNFLGKQGSKPSAALLVGVAASFPGVDARWLLTGEPAWPPPGDPLESVRKLLDGVRELETHVTGLRRRLQGLADQRGGAA